MGPAPLPPAPPAIVRTAAGLRSMSLSQLQEIVEILEARGIIAPPPMLSHLSSDGYTPIRLSSPFPPIGRKTKGRRDESLRSRANRRKS